MQVKQLLLLFYVCCFSFGVSAQVAYLESLENLKSQPLTEQINTSSSFAAAKKKGKGIKVLFGLKAGASTANLEANEVTFQNAGRQFTLAVDNNEFAYHLGVFTQVRLNKWNIQPEVLFRSARADYQLSELVSTEIISSIRSETYSYVDIPLMLAYRLGALRIQAGPVAKFYINSSTELIGIANLTQSYQDMDFGYQAGIGLDIWRLVVDLKYDRDIDPVGDHISFAGQQLDFNQTAGRFVFSIGYSFLSP